MNFKFEFIPTERKQLLANGRKRCIGYDHPNLFPVLSVIDPYGRERMIASIDPEDQDMVWGFSNHGDKVHLEDYRWSDLERAARREGRAIQRHAKISSYQPVMDFYRDALRKELRLYKD